ncbi:Endoribonuclease YbeY [Planctomycetales bacterium 10988]|nr:Endoribonuclease YbeY [Planctomycetales bacterium 10988]
MSDLETPHRAIEIHNDQDFVRIDTDSLTQAVSQVFEEEQVRCAHLSIAILDDPQIHVLNRQFLAHDYPTDVLSFLLEESPKGIEGEVIVSAETALRESEKWGWSPEEELLLYLIHGTLHLVGYDDLEVEAAQIMRARERHFLNRCGISVPTAPPSRFAASLAGTERESPVPYQDPKRR